MLEGVAGWGVASLRGPVKGAASWLAALGPGGPPLTGPLRFADSGSYVCAAREMPVSWAASSGWCVGPELGGPLLAVRKRWLVILPSWASAASAWSSWCGGVADNSSVVQRRNRRSRWWGLGSVLVGGSLAKSQTESYECIRHVIAQPLPSLRIGSSRRPLCVTGMGRCGTSLTTRLIGLPGVDLGPTDRMLPADRNDSGRGYWEQREIYEINEEIMATFGGTWEWPPAFPLGWERSPVPYYARASPPRASEPVRGCEGRWAWKDPRASVTLPFWRNLTGPMDYVLCIRNPADVAASLSKRGNDELDFDHSVVIWLHYAKAALQNTHGSRRLILRYEDYFSDTDRQISRLAGFVCRGVRRTSPEAVELYARLEESRRKILRLSRATGVSGRVRMSSDVGRSSSPGRQQRSRWFAP
jgi:hypothetical protein